MHILNKALCCFKNAQTARKTSLSFPFSRKIWAFFQVLVFHGYIEGVQKNGKKMQVFLKSSEKGFALKELVQISSSVHRVFWSSKKVQQSRSGLNLYILSTPLGIMSETQAKTLNIGGEVLCKIR